MASELVEIKNEVAVTTSLKISEYFGKEHFNVLRDIRNLVKQLAEVEKEASNQPAFKIEGTPKYFIKGSYDDAQGQARTMYYVTQDGFNLLAMGFTGIEALKYKLAFIEEFNRRGSELEAIRNGEYLLRQQAARELYMPKYHSAMSAIERLTAYAERFGVPKAYFNGKVDNIYARINGAANKAAGVVKGTRPDATPDQSTHLKNIYLDVEAAIDRGIAAGANWASVIQSALDAIDAYGARYVRGGETPMLEAPKVEAPKRQARRSERSGWTRRSSSKIIEYTPREPWYPTGNPNYDFED